LVLRPSEEIKVLEILIFLMAAVTSPALFLPVFLNILTFSLLVVEEGNFEMIDSLGTKIRFLTFLFEVLKIYGFGRSISSATLAEGEETAEMKFYKRIGSLVSLRTFWQFTYFERLLIFKLFFY
jgi:hypothetical protein